jgi:DNA primase
MRFSPAFLDEIRARLPVSEVVGKRVKLRKQGREWAGLSPFNAEKTPSFFVNDQKGFYHDFSSSKHGDIFSFLIETEGLTFPDAVERLAQMAGVALPAVSSQDQQQEKRRATQHEVLSLAARYFEKTLADRAGAKAGAYLATRGLDAEVQREFGLGYSTPDRFALRDALAAQGVSGEAMVEAGLLIHGEDIAVPYDRFRDRIMFPIQDRSGRVIAFGGRAMEKDAKAKYLNSPETELFHKGSVLFNHHRARKAAHEKGEVIVVEGYIDVIAMTRAGYPQTVAPLGTALTGDQCALLWRMAEEPIVCLDGDRAGQKAAFRAIDTALPLIGAGKSLRFAILPEGQDPDDLARSGGASAIAAVLQSARPLAEMLFLRETDGQSFDTPERRAGLERRLRELTDLIADEMLRRHYWQDMSSRAAALFGAAKQAQARPNGSYGDRQRGSAGGRRSRFEAPGPRMGIAGAPLASRQGLAGRPKNAPRETIILAVALCHPGLLERHIEEIAELDFASRGLAAFRNSLVALAGEAHGGAESLAQALESAGLGEQRANIVARAANMADWWAVRPEAALDDAEQVMRQTLALHRKSFALNRELKLAERALAEDPTEHNFARLLDIKQDLADLAGAEAAIDGFGAQSGRSNAPV